MKSGFAVFWAVVIALGASWTGFVLGSSLQLGKAKLTTVLNSAEVYPIQRTGEATTGLQVYRAEGCAACHTEQVGQDGVAFDVALLSPGKKPLEVTNALSKLGKLTGLTKEEADTANDQLAAAGAKVETHLSATGGDISRGWGVRHSVAADYIYDSPVQLGSLRAGPDLADIGTRLADANVQLMHLYAPGSVVNNSTMPSFKFLFEVRKIDGAPSPDALKLPPQFAPAAGFEVVPKPEAKQLVAYLLSLHANVPLYEAPFTPNTAKP